MKSIIMAALLAMASMNVFADDEKHYSCDIQPIFVPSYSSPTQYYKPTTIQVSYFEGTRKVDFRIDGKAVRVHVQLIRGYDEINMYNIALADMTILVANRPNDLNVYNEAHYKQRTGFKNLNANGLPEKFNLYINGKAPGSKIFLGTGHLQVSTTCTKI